jgi:hypothetical protein
MTTSPDIEGNLGQSKRSGHSSLDSLSRLLVDENGQPLKAAPPVEKWNPKYCGEMDLVMWREEDADGDRYYLKTPAEKIQIQVEDVPLLVVDVNQVEDQGQTFIRCTTKTGDVVIADAEHRIEMRHFNQNGVDERRPYIRIRRNLDALIHRNAFYHLIGWSELQPKEAGEAMVLQSGQEQFILGTI